jgi:hypothetical protein
MKTRILILGAGFGGLELSTSLSGALGDSVEVTLIDASDGFVFGFAKLDLMFGRATEAAIRHPYAAFTKPGVRLLREAITAIDPVAKRVMTDKGFHDADILVWRWVRTTMCRARRAWCWGGTNSTRWPERRIWRPCCPVSPAVMSSSASAARHTNARRRRASAP